MTFYDFASEHYFATILLAWFLMWSVTVCWIRLFRVIQISKHGWPPEHLDADGDWKPKE